MAKIAIIPARGGSKRIPRKNIKEFYGKPIIAYSIEAALNSNMFDEVMVSTDDEEIASIAKKYGASLPFMRSEATSHDMAMTAPVLEEVLSEYKKIGKEFDYLCCIYSTAPFITSEKIKGTFDLLIKENADSAFPMVKYGSPPIQKSFKMVDGKMYWRWPELADVRSQDIEDSYQDTGQFYWLRASSFLEQKTMYMKHMSGYIIPTIEHCDIDNPEDWETAEMLYKLVEEKHGI